MTPGKPEGTSKAELRVLPVAAQLIVMEAWFRANFQAARAAPYHVAAYPDLELAREFGGAVQPEAIAALGRRLSEASWLQIADDLFDRKTEQERRDILLARVEATEIALAKLNPQYGGIGHNNPPDGPLTPEAQIEAPSALADIRNEAAAEQPALSLVQRAASRLQKIAAGIGYWIWKRAEMVFDETLKKAAGTFGVFTAADVMDAWQKLTALIELLGRWLSFH